MKRQQDRKSKTKLHASTPALSSPRLRRRYLGRPNFADAGFLRQRPDAADEAERVRELLPARLEDRALRRRHELRRVAPRPRARHGQAQGAPRGSGWAKTG